MRGATGRHAWVNWTAHATMGSLVEHVTGHSCHMQTVANGCMQELTAQCNCGNCLPQTKGGVSEIWVVLKPQMVGRGHMSGVVTTSQLSPSISILCRGPGFGVMAWRGGDVTVVM